MNLIKNYRTKHNLSVIKFSHLIGTSRQHVYELERGYKASVKLAIKIEKVTNGEVTAIDLLGINKIIQL